MFAGKDVAHPHGEGVGPLFLGDGSPVALLDRLGVASQPSDMSFSVRCEETGLEYNGTSLNSIERLAARRGESTSASVSVRVV